MNSVVLTDPVVLICAAIVVIGVIAFFWAVGKFKSVSISTEATNADEFSATAQEPVPNLDLRPQDMPFRAPAASAPSVSPEVADRLESMSQRLSEMQNVLMKQSASSAGAGAGAGGVGQGFSPETVEKLLKIIGNVMQQVDILQKSLNLTK